MDPRAAAQPLCKSRCCNRKLSDPPFHQKDRQIQTRGTLNKTRRARTFRQTNASYLHLVYRNPDDTDARFWKCGIISSIRLLCEVLDFMDTILRHRYVAALAVTGLLFVIGTFVVVNRSAVP